MEFGSWAHRKLTKKKENILFHLDNFTLPNHPLDQTIGAITKRKPPSLIGPSHCSWVHTQKDFLLIKAKIYPSLEQKTQKNTKKIEHPRNPKNSLPESPNNTSTKFPHGKSEKEILHSYTYPPEGKQREL